MLGQTIVMMSTAPGPPKARGPTPPSPLLKPISAAQAVVRNLRIPQVPNLFGSEQKSTFVPPDVPRDRTDEDTSKGPFRMPVKSNSKKDSDFTSPFGSALEQASWSTSRDQQQEQKSSRKSVFSKILGALSP